MHYVASAIIMASYFVLVALLKSNPRQRHWAYFALGLLPFTINAWDLDSALVNWPSWPGYAKGVIMTLMDSLALAVIVTQRGPRGLPPLSGYIIAYLLAAALSVPMADVPMASFFYVFQLLRVLIVVVAIAKFAHDPRAVEWLVMGLAAGITFQAGYTVWQKIQGAFQTSGTMGHQNLLGLMTHFALLPIMAVLLSGSRSRVLMIGVASALLVIAFGASRGTIGFGMLGAVSLLGLSLYRRSTPHKWRMFGFAALALTLASPLMLQAMHKRFAQAAEQRGGSDERAAFERAANMIWADHPMGIGANQYVVVASTKGYSQRAGVVWNWTSRSANVHNTYLLAAAETGWAGFLTFIAMFAAIILAGLRFAFRYRPDPRGDIVLGCTTAVIITALHNLYEWVFVTYQAQYVFAISVGLIAGLTRARALERRARNHRQQMTGERELAMAKDEPAPAGTSARAR